MTSSHRYHTLAIALHWTMAMGFVFMVYSGWYMVNGELSKAEQFDLYQVHKASGVLMLWAVVLRLLVRVAVKRPGLPAEIPLEQHKIASMGHSALYIGLVVIPVAGWIMVSASPFGLPTFVFFEWLKWPHIPGVARNKTIESVAKLVHWYAVLGMGILLLGHIGAVIMHRIKHKVSLVQRMWWS